MENKRRVKVWGDVRRPKKHFYWDVKKTEWSVNEKGGSGENSEDGIKEFQGK